MRAIPHLLLVKGDKFGDHECPKNEYNINQMKVVPYALPVGSL